MKHISEWDIAVTAFRELAKTQHAQHFREDGRAVTKVAFSDAVNVDSARQWQNTALTISGPFVLAGTVLLKSP